MLTSVHFSPYPGAYTDGMRAGRSDLTASVDVAGYNRFVGTSRYQLYGERSIVPDSHSTRHGVSAIARVLKLLFGYVLECRLPTERSLGERGLEILISECIDVTGSLASTTATFTAVDVSSVHVCRGGGDVNVMVAYRSERIGHTTSDQEADGVVMPLRYAEIAFAGGKRLRINGLSMMIRQAQDLSSRSLTRHRKTQSCRAVLRRGCGRISPVLA